MRKFFGIWVILFGALGSFSAYAQQCEDGSGRFEAELCEFSCPTVTTYCYLEGTYPRTRYYGSWVCGLGCANIDEQLTTTTCEPPVWELDPSCRFVTDSSRWSR